MAVTSLPCRGTPGLKTAVMPLRNEAPSSPKKPVVMTSLVCYFSYIESLLYKVHSTETNYKTPHYVIFSNDSLILLSPFPILYTIMSSEKLQFSFFLISNECNASELPINRS